MSENKMVQFPNFKLSPILIEDLRRIADIERCSLAELMRRILTRHADEYKKTHTLEPILTTELPSPEQLAEFKATLEHKWFEYLRTNMTASHGLRVRSKFNVFVESIAGIEKFRTVAKWNELFERLRTLVNQKDGTSRIIMAIDVAALRSQNGETNERA